MSRQVRDRFSVDISRRRSLSGSGSFWVVQEEQKEPQVPRGITDIVCGVGLRASRPVPAAEISWVSQKTRRSRR